MRCDYCTAPLGAAAAGSTNTVLFNRLVEFVDQVVSENLARERILVRAKHTTASKQRRLQTYSMTCGTVCAAVCHSGHMFRCRLRAREVVPWQGNGVRGTASMHSGRRFRYHEQQMSASKPRAAPARGTKPCLEHCGTRKRVPYMHAVPTTTYSHARRRVGIPWRVRHSLGCTFCSR